MLVTVRQFCVEASCGAEQVPEALRLLEASQSCRSLTSLKISLRWTWDKDVGARSNAQIVLCLPKLEGIEVPLIFCHLNLERCSALIKLVVKDKCSPSSSLDGGAMVARAKAMSMLRDVAGSVLVPAKPGHWLAAFRKPLEAEDFHWHPAAAYATRYWDCHVYPSCSKEEAGPFSITTP